VFIATWVDGAMAAPLLVSLSVPTDDDLTGAGALAAGLDARGVPLSLLLRPRGPRGPIGPDSAPAAWVRERRAGGDALVLHGYDHVADPTAAKRLALGRRAEFAALPRHEAGLRLTAARRVLTALGLRTDAFAPPRWLASPGTVAALVEQGFAVLADEAGVRRLDGAAPPVRARVLGVRAVAGLELRGQRPLVVEAARAARRGGGVRIHVRAADLADPAPVLAAVDAALAAGAVPTTYRIGALARAA
jgi:predicted deacetylase